MIQERETTRPLADLTEGWERLGNRAIEIASIAHKDQKDLAGTAYIHHVFSVAHQTGHYEEFLVAMLHDVVEDSDWTIEMLRQEGFPETVLEAVEVLTRRTEEDYDAYIERVGRSSPATRVKLLDLEHNMDLTRLPEVTSLDLRRLQRYQKAWKYLYDRKHIQEQEISRSDHDG